MHTRTPLVDKITDTVHINELHGYMYVFIDKLLTNMYK
jgi:hypothetical protein